MPICYPFLLSCLAHFQVVHIIYTFQTQVFFYQHMFPSMKLSFLQYLLNDVVLNFITLMYQFYILLFHKF